MLQALPRQLSVWRPTSLETVLRGAAYYPEHVDESLWIRDAERLAAAGANVVRMGEFAWHIWEPEEGRFSFDLFDRAIETLARHGIRTILCTPTATPPRWLTRDYPEVLRVDASGNKMCHGSRQHCDTTSPVLRSHSRRITTALADHYRDNESVIGWQTDNELNTTVSESYSPSCRLAFQVWLRHRYEGDIAALNRAWGGDFWALAYDSFADVELPRQSSPSFVSPGHLQDFHRFLAEATAAFQHDQVTILRRTKPDWFVFHNLGGLADVDPRGAFGKDLDFLGFDIYPMLFDELLRGGGHGPAQAWHLDLCRAFAGNFIVPEQASGLGSQPAFSTLTPEPGEMRRMALTSIARGADGLLFFRWRPAHFGAEIYWMGLIDHDDTARRRYDEAARFFGDLERLDEHLLGTHVRMDMAIAGADFDNTEAHKGYAIGLPSPMDDARLLHRAAYRSGLACGVIHPEDDLSPLKVLYVPHMVMWKKEWTPAVSDWVEAGGTLILSALTGTRDDKNHIHSEQAPGAGLAELAGVRVQEFGRIVAPGASGLNPMIADTYPGAFIDPTPLPASSKDRGQRIGMGNSVFPAGHLYERLDVSKETDVIGTWLDRWLAGEPAVTRRKIGKGQVIYLATYLTHELADYLVQTICIPSGATPLIPELPEGIEVSIRQAEDRTLLFVLNTNDQPAAVKHVPKGADLLTGNSHPGGTLILESYGCAVISVDSLYD